MNLEKILSERNKNHSFRMERIILEDRYPILFTCKKDKRVFIFICHSVNADSIQWIASETSYQNIINMLSDKITLRDAFLNISETKYMLKFDGRELQCIKCNKYEIPSEFLPTADEYMEADKGEFDEEIAFFKNMMKICENNHVFAIKDVSRILFPVKCSEVLDVIYNITPYEVQSLSSIKSLINKIGVVWYG